MHNDIASPSAIADRLDRLPLSRWHRRMVLLIGLGAFFSFFEVALGSFFGVLLNTQWTLTAADKSMIVGSAFLGEMIGSLTLAPLADRFGRRRMFQVNLIAYAALSLAAALSPNLTVFLVLRVLTGIGLGAELTLVDTYLSELLPARRRGRYIAWSYTFGLTAAPVAGILAKSATGTILGLAGWRWLLILAAGGGLVAWLSRRRLPESPRWLATTGRLAEADRVVTAIERETGAPLDDPAPVPPAATRPDPGRYRRRSVLMWLMWIFTPIGFYAFASIAPIVLLAKGFDLAHSLTYSALTAAGYPLGSLASVYLTERFERRTLVIASTLAAAASGVVFGLGTVTGVIITAGVATTVSTIVQSNAVHIYQCELFHTANRSTAIGMPYAASRLISALLPFGAIALLSAAGASGLYLGCAVLLVVMAIVARWLGPRTNNQRLDEI
ncbi:MFS transporter [Kutzneria buriramensis]|uniref:Putative MFS transporter n=1 Tax=Kutzneria buriramensis TaxID=1045776 RepID=A0A3E0HIG8_9PSEU|nr:MFS transporter [Kutzneria buriramensis]REH46284.1 putative MFS transporter [Kutzneria buriramensis]